MPMPEIIFLKNVSFYISNLNHISFPFPFLFILWILHSHSIPIALSIPLGLALAYGPYFYVFHTTYTYFLIRYEKIKHRNKLKLL